MLKRDRFEKEYRWIFEKHRHGSTVWSPLAGGILAGKYNDGNIPEGSRYDSKEGMINSIWNSYMGEGVRAKTIDKLQKLAALAKETGYSQAQLALAWVIASKDVSTALLGFTKVSQVEENLKALELYRKWTPELEKKVNDILETDPAPDVNFRTW
eukprot:CAMPEP_0202964660 /NCGR_PEP_ID=MMETSP1396-20130829/8738_1 /ASSEMBLY_ACC=CAM_ASM_000872 /TAXON_ID= /ORGANISM="Pseudokeronopsis sp., Strain Brazil" /LENGTH=154 /DNA_ID=CAMNT_0049686913 /DNA_START=457 /DNA_END=918 /DNA_ORIENTATION=-